MWFNLSKAETLCRPDVDESASDESLQKETDRLGYKCCDKETYNGIRNEQD